MHNWIRSRILHFMRVPHDPAPPFGAAGSIHVFRAGKNFLNLRLFKWSLAQIGAFIGIIFWYGVFSDLDKKVEEQRSLAAQPKPAASAPASPNPAPAPHPSNNAVERVVNKVVSEVQAQASETEKKIKHARTTKQKFGPVQGFYAWRSSMVYFLSRLPKPAMLVIWFLEMAGFILYVLQLPVTLLVVRLEFEQHWYIVTDRSLRIRTGLFQLTESTMSFANLQQVEVKQGPLQRLLGLADVHVQSAGGGGDQDKPHARDSLHTGIFHSVDNAAEIRDLIQHRLRQFREAGLGDLDDHHDHVPVGGVPPPREASAANADALAAAREVLAEVRALRASLG